MTEPTVASSSSDMELGSEKEQTTAAAASGSSRNVRGMRWALIIMSVLGSTFMFGLDNTISADVQPAIVERFSSINQISWVSVAFLMTAGSTTFFWGQMYSQFNLKYLYIISIVLFEIGSALCGAAPNMDTLIVGRAICGIGGAGSYCGVMTLISVLTTEQERPLYLSIPSITWGGAMVLGPIIGGAFTVSKAGWRWAFYINLVIGAAFAPVYLLLVPSKDIRPGALFKDRVKSIDFVGFIIASGVFVSLLMAITFGGSLYPWNSGQVIALFVVAGVLTTVYFLQQYFCVGTPKENRMIPFEFMNNIRLMLVFYCGSACATAVYIPVYFLPLYFQFVRGDSALIAGVRLLPMVCFLIATILAVGFVVSRTGKWHMWFLAGSILVVIGSALLFTVDENTSYARIYGYSIIMGAGAGCYLQLPFAASQYCVPQELIPVAVGLISFAQLAAPSVTLSIGNTLFVNKASWQMATYLPQYSTEQITRIISGVGQEYLDQLSTAQRDGATGIMTRAMGKSYIIVIVSGATSFIASIFLIGLRVADMKKTKLEEKKPAE